MRELKPMILFVDDEELARRTFKRIADKEFRVLLAESVDEAIKILADQHEEIGVLLSDQRMPGRLGVDLLEHCRKNYPKIIRMLTTAYSELNDAIAAVNRGEIMRYIEKPWGNIDGLLIDLRVAMSLYEMRSENDHLIAEKLSVGYKTSRLDKIRTLITVAACQPQSNSLVAVESLLRQVAAIEAYREMPSIQDMQNYQVFGQPLNESIGAVEIGKYLTEKLQENDSSSISWSELQSDIQGKNIELSLDETGIDFPPPETFKNIICSAKMALIGEQSGSLVGAVNFDENGIRLNIKLHEKESTTLSEWLTGQGLSPSLNARIAAMLEVFLLTYEVDGRAELDLTALGLIKGLEFHFYGDKNDVRQQSQSVDYDWIDDLMILFS